MSLLLSLNIGIECGELLPQRWVSTTQEDKDHPSQCRESNQNCAPPREPASALGL